MISCLFIATSSGKLLVLRLFRGDVTREDALIFCRNVLCNARNSYVPTYRYEKLNFFRVNLDGLNLVALTRRNGNAFLIFHTLTELKKLLYSFFAGVINEDNITNNASVVYELFDETIDGGYTQNMEPLVLADVMTTKATVRGVCSDVHNYNASRLGFLPKFAVDPESYLFDSNMPFEGKLNESEECLEYCQQVVTMMATSVVPPWRKIKGLSNRNSITVELLENMNVLYNHNSELITYEVTGSLVVNAMLMGTPLVHLRMNDDFNYLHGHVDGFKHSASYKSYQTNASSSQFQLPVAAKQLVRLDDYKFHQCVNLESIRSNKTISFIPPEGMFVLLCYRSTSSATIPFVIRPKVKKLDSLHLSYSISLAPTFSKAILAQRASMRIPIPRTTKEVVPGTMSSATTFEVNLSHHFVTWSFKKLQGESNYLLNFTAVLTSNKLVNSMQSLPNVNLDFTIPWFSSSGLYVASIECSNAKGKVSKNVNYQTKGGLYHHRLKYF